MLICSSIFPQLFTGKFDLKKQQFLGRFLADKGYFFDWSFSYTVGQYLLKVNNKNIQKTIMGVALPSLSHSNVLVMWFIKGKYLFKWNN